MNPVEFCPPPARPARMAWVDLFRGVAVILMIETHVLNTFLAAPLRETWLFGWLNFFNGLVAPAFLFIAGYLQGLGMHRPQVPARKWGRLAGLLAIAYLLHFPWGLLDGAHGEQALRVGSQVDVLQCLAVSLGLLLAVQVLGGVLRGALGARFVPWVVLGGIVAVLAASNAVQPWMGGTVPLRAFVNASTGSLFPLFPWLAFVWSGALLALMGKRLGTGDGWSGAARGLLAPGLVLAAGYYAFPLGKFSAVGPAFFLQRLGWVLLAAWAFQWLSGPLEFRWVLLAGRESLSMYVAHLLLIVFIAGKGLRNLDFAAAWGLYSAVLAMTWLAAWGWQALREGMKAKG